MMNDISTLLSLCASIVGAISALVYMTTYRKLTKRFEDLKEQLRRVDSDAANNPAFDLSQKIEDPEIEELVRMLFLREISNSLAAQKLLMLLGDRLAKEDRAWLEKELIGYPVVNDTLESSRVRKYRLVYINRTALLIDDNAHEVSLKGSTNRLFWISWSLSDIEEKLLQSSDDEILIPFTLPGFDAPRGSKTVYLVHRSQLERICERFRGDLFEILKSVVVY